MSKAPLSILLVEDHLGIARQVLDFLDGLGWQTDHAGTGALAVQLAAQRL
jgi:CheY-like chemotaxis protein